MKPSRRSTATIRSKLPKEWYANSKSTPRLSLSYRYRRYSWQINSKSRIEDDYFLILVCRISTRIIHLEDTIVCNLLRLFLIWKMLKLMSSFVYFENNFSIELKYSCCSSISNWTTLRSYFSLLLLLLLLIQFGTMLGAKVWTNWHILKI